MIYIDKTRIIRITISDYKVKSLFVKGNKFCFSRVELFHSLFVCRELSQSTDNVHGETPEIASTRELLRIPSTSVVEEAR